jgi:uncharacterized membrane protein
MKLLLSFLILVFTVSFLPITIARAQGSLEPSTETITGFHSDININQNTSLTIKETITYFSPVEKHGIFRYIPLKYRRGQKVFTTKINDVHVTDLEANTLIFNSYTENGNLVLKIGDPNRTFIGNRTYIILYTVADALAQFPDHDELYWDITGEGWQFPIDNTSAVIQSPYAVISKIACYSGTIGTDNGLCQATHQANTASISYNQPIGYGDNVTVALSLDKPNRLMFPTATDRFFKSLTDNLAFILIPLPLLITFLLWFYWGRDFESVSGNIFNLDLKQTKRLKPIFAPARIPFIYEPLKDLTPAETGAIIDEKVQNSDIIADIIDLARQKYLKLSSSEIKGFFSTSTEYTFTKLKAADTALPTHQEMLMNGIFAAKDTTTLSELKGTFYTTMEKVRKTVEDALTKRQLYTKNPTTGRVLGAVFAVLVNAAVFFLVMPTAIFLGAIWPFLLFGAQAVLSLFFGLNLVQKTVVGNNLMLQAKGLQYTINTGKWREEIKEKNLFIEEVLPYAIALGVISKLAKDMQDLGLDPPQYFQAMGFTGTNWSSFVGDFTAHASSSMSYNPSSSNWSGGSGFSGGSSGGGGGGGGGGSW